ncbi:MAG: lysophospholipid acyltransferase family protein [Candidatus Omnitrophota bacterium]
MLFWIGRFIFFVILRVFFFLKVEGCGNIPSRRGFIVACNHISNLDPIVVGVACPRAINFMAKQELFGNRIFGFILRRVRAFPVRRGQADVGAVKEAIRRLRAGEGLLLFPQGGRGRGWDIKQAKDGVGMFAAKLGVAVVPAVVRGTERALPRGRVIPRPARINVCFGPPIMVEGSDNKDYTGITRKVMSAIEEMNR